LDERVEVGEAVNTSGDTLLRVPTDSAKSLVPTAQPRAHGGMSALTSEVVASHRASRGAGLGRAGLLRNDLREDPYHRSRAICATTILIELEQLTYSVIGSGNSASD